MAQLKPEQRYTISVLLQQKKKQYEIAEAIGVNKSTVSRELKRNGSKRGYSWRQAQELCDMRKERLGEPRKMCSQVIRRIERYRADCRSVPQRGIPDGV